jgi:hypothetical protein
LLRLSRRSLRGQKRFDEVGARLEAKDIGRTSDILDLVMERSGYEELNPVQRLAVEFP